MVYDLFKKTVLAGIGLAVITKEKLENLARELAEQENLSEEEGKKLMEELIKKSDVARKDLESRIEELVLDVLKKLNIPSRQDYLKLEQEIAKLKKKLQAKR
jgi:polyhydroxyalkanoate synthesis regulator phasin